MLVSGKARIGCHDEGVVTCVAAMFKCVRAAFHPGLDLRCVPLTVAVQCLHCFSNLVRRRQAALMVPAGLQRRPADRLLRVGRGVPDAGGIVWVRERHVGRGHVHGPGCVCLWERERVCV